jgi:hypothetical protein
MSAESLRIINAAISRQNGVTITAGDGSKEAILFDLNYEQIVTSELSGPSWKFARKVQLLSALPDAPADTDWDFALQLPSDLIMLRSLIVDGQPIEYEVGPNSTVLADKNEDVYAVFTYRAPEDNWPPDFKEGIIRRLEAVLLSSDERGGALMAERNEAADDKFAQARRTHAQEEAPKDPYSYPLVSVRRAGIAASRR